MKLVTLLTGLLLCFPPLKAAEGLLDNAVSVLDLPALMVRSGMVASPLSLLELRTPELGCIIRYDDLYRETEDTRTPLMAYRYRAELTGAAALSAPAGGVAAIGSGTDRALLKADDGYSRQEYDEQRTWRSAAYAREFKKCLQAGFALRQNTAPRAWWDKTVAFRLLPVRGISAGYAYRQWTDHADAGFIVEDMDMLVPLEYTVARHGMTFGVNGPLAGADLEYHFSSYGTDSAEAVGFSTVPELTDHGYGLTWQAGPWHGYTVRMLGDASYLDGVIRVYSDGVKFGKVTRARYARQRGTADVTWQHGKHSVTMGGGSTRGSGTFKGSIESWPFTAAVTDLLGARRYFRMEGTMRTDLIAAVYGFTPRPGHHADLSLRHLSFYPNGKGTLWNTILMGLGITGLEHYYMAVTAVRVLDCSAEYRLTCRKIDISVRAGQLIPLLISYKPHAAGPTGSGGSSHADRSVRGGTSVAVRAAYRF